MLKLIVGGLSLLSFFMHALLRWLNLLRCRGIPKVVSSKHPELSRLRMYHRLDRNSRSEPQSFFGMLDGVTMESAAAHYLEVPRLGDRVWLNYKVTRSWTVVFLMWGVLAFLLVVYAMVYA